MTRDLHRRGRAALGTTAWRTGDSWAVGAALVLVLVAAVLHATGPGAIAPFAASALAIAALAVVVGRAVQQVGARWSPKATGVLQATVGNLPELLFGLFALRAGLTGLVQAALVGSVLANVLLVLGLAFTVGGARFGTQRFDAPAARTVVVLLLVAAAVVAVPSATALAHTAASRHEPTLSMVAAVVLLVVYVGSLFVRSAPAGSAPGMPDGQPSAAPAPPAAVLDRAWPVPLGVAVLVVASLAAAAVSDWFVGSLQPALRSLGLSTTFTGIVVVAIAGNAVENVGGIMLAGRDRMDHAVAVILQSPVQVLLGVFPLLVVVSPAFGGGALTLALPGLLLVGLVVAAVVAVAVVVDGESTWVEGVCLVGLYAVLAAAAWWG